MLLCLATFEEDLRKKLQQPPTPPALPEIQPPSTDAELITDLRQERYSAARDKLKLQEEKALPTRLTPPDDRDTGRRHQQQVLNQDPEAPAPVTFRSAQQGSSIFFKEQLQATATQKAKDTAEHHRALHRSAIEAHRRSEPPTSTVSYNFTPRQARAQSGNSWGAPIPEEETGRHTHFVESKDMQTHLQPDPVGYHHNRRPSQQSWGNNEVFRRQSTSNPNSHWGRPDEAFTPQGYGQAKADYDVAHSRRWAPYAQRAVPTTTPYKIGHQTYHDTRGSNNNPCSPFNIQRTILSQNSSLHGRILDRWRR